MPPERLKACAPLAAGSALIALAVLPSPLGGWAFLLEWAGSLLAFAGISYLAGPKLAFTLAGGILVTGNIGDLVLIGGLNLVDWALINYMIFIHSAAGSLLGDAFRRNSLHLIDRRR